LKNAGKHNKNPLTYELFRVFYGVILAKDSHHDTVEAKYAKNYTDKCVHFRYLNAVEHENQTYVGAKRLHQCEKHKVPIRNMVSLGILVVKQAHTLARYQ
jgi:hypothetical protein